jgi:hypothetical protein
MFVVGANDKRYNFSEKAILKFISSISIKSILSLQTVLFQGHVKYLHTKRNICSCVAEIELHIMGRTKAI